MSSPSESSQVELEVSRIRELSKSGRHSEALAAAKSLAATVPQNRDVLYLIAANHRCLSRLAEALETLRRLEEHHPQFSLLYQERGYCYVSLREAPHAIEAFERAVELNPALGTSWSMLERLYRMIGDAKKAAAAATGYVRLLIDRQQYLQAREAADSLLKIEPCNPHYLSVYAAACAGLGEHETAIAAYRRLVAALPESSSGAAELHVSLGNCLKSAGRQQEAIESYQTAAAIRPRFGDAWWSLANLKTYRSSREEIAQMRAEEAAPGADPADRYHLCFALGKAHEDRSEYAESWQFYERGNRLKRAETAYHPEIAESNARQQIEVCTAQFFAERAGVGAPDPDPIFIVGLPRSGSTLIEQILASHSHAEGTQELFELPRIADEIGGTGRIHRLLPDDFRRLGQRYLNATRAYRKGKPFFIDKMPNNFRHIGLIHLMLPNATIIDTRREPMACCFSNLKQLFASGQEFTYSVADIARYYRTYLELMRHWDAVLPGRVMHVWYEDIVADLAGNVKRILEFCGLEFEPACAEFYKTERNVHSASSEQVRQPIFREGLFQWQNYEPWLGALREALGDALVRYRDDNAPAEQRSRTVRYTE
jgi:tetratricopeptide (TPR) repeat protein